MILCLADWFTRVVDRIMCGRPARPTGPVTPQRWDRLVRAGAVTEHEDDRPA